MNTSSNMLQAGGGDVIVWLFLGLIWFVIQIVGSRAKAKTRRPGATPSPSKRDKDDAPEALQQFLESLTGASGAPRPGFRILSPPDLRTQPRRTTPPRKNRQPPPAPAPAHHAAPPPPPTLSLNEETQGTHQRQLQRREIVLPKAMPAQRGMRLPMIIKLSGLDRHRMASITRPDLQGKTALKKAILARVILGAPVALADNGLRRSAISTGSTTTRPR